MSGLNKAILIGNLGADPEVKFTQNGQAVLKLRLATSEKWKNKDGELQERTEWHNVVMWGPRAEALGKILAKGRTIYVEGRIQTRSYEDKDGVKKYATDINANELLLLGGRSEGGDRQESGGQQRQGRPSGARKPETEDGFPDSDFVDGDIPF